MNTLATPRIDLLDGLFKSYDQLGQLERRLGVLRQRLDEVRAYLAAPGSNQHLGEAQLERARTQYSATLAGLRNARREAHRRLGLTGSAERPHFA